MRPTGKTFYRMKDLPEIVGLAETQIRTEVAGGSLPPDLKADLNEKRRALMDKLKELEAEIGEG